MTDVIETAGGVVAEARDLIETYVKAEVINVTVSDGGETLSVPAVRKGSEVLLYQPNAFDAWRTHPRDRRGVATLLTLDSLIDHANRFKDAESVVFADNDRAKPSITVVLDYHPSGEAASVAPRFGAHRGHYAFPLSDEWKAWTGADGEVMKMAKFAEFLEERLPDILDLIPSEDGLPENLQKLVNSCGGPEAIAGTQQLLELSRGLQIYENSAVKEAVRLQSGEGVVSFEVQHTTHDGKPLRVPGLFLIAIPVFRNDTFYRLAARLRYRKTGEGIVFWYDLWRADPTFDDAFTQAVARVGAETELPVLIGKPE